MYQDELRVSTGSEPLSPTNGMYSQIASKQQRALEMANSADNVLRDIAVVFLVALAVASSAELALRFLNIH